MLKFQKFKLKMLDEIKKIYNLVELEGDRIKIQKGSVEATLVVKDAYSEYKVVEDFEFICGHYLTILEQEFKKGRFTVTYENVFPLIKKKGFGDTEKLNFVKEHLFLDLDTFYVCDMEKSFRFVLEEDEFDLDRLKKSAFRNINKINTPLVKLDKDLEIYTLYFPSDYAASLILSEKFKEQIKKKVGENFLFAMPSATGILVSRDESSYADILKHIAITDNDPHKISSNIYRYKKDKYEYVDQKNTLKVIK